MTRKTKNKGSSKKKDGALDPSKDVMILREYGEPMNTVLRIKLKEHADYLKSKLEDIPLCYSPNSDAILSKLTYPFEEDSIEDFLALRKDLVPYRMKDDAQLFREADVHWQFILGKAAQIKKMEVALYGCFKECPEKEHLLKVHGHLGIFLKKVTTGKIDDQVRVCYENYHYLHNKDPVEEICTTRHKLIDYQTSDPFIAVLRDSFKIMLMNTDGFRLTTKRYSAALTLLETEFHSAEMADKRLSNFADLAKLHATRKKRDEHMVQLSYCFRMILARLVQLFPIYLGTAIEEYLASDYVYKKWDVWKNTLEEVIMGIPATVRDPVQFMKYSQEEAQDVYEKYFGNLKPPKVSAPPEMSAEEERKMRTCRIITSTIHQAFKDAILITRGKDLGLGCDDFTDINARLFSDRKSKKAEEDGNGDDEELDWSVPGTSFDSLSDMMKRCSIAKSSDK